MRTTRNQINPEMLQPVVEANITFTRNKALVDSCKDIGKVKCLLSYPPSKPRKVITGLDTPCSIAVNSEGVMVVGGEGSNCITVINEDGSIVRSFGLDGKLNGKYGECLGVVFTTDGHIVVSDGHSHKLYKLTLQGEYIASVGSKGSGPLEFDHPNEIDIILQQERYMLLIATTIVSRSSTTTSPTLAVLAAKERYRDNYLIPLV